MAETDPGLSRPGPPTMVYFYVPGHPENGAIRLADAERVHHLRNVLRLGAGEEIAVFDGRGQLLRCVIESIGEREAVLRVRATVAARPPAVRLTIACALPKADRMDDIVDKLTQLGVDAVLPMRTRRVVSRLDEAGARNRLERWRRISIAAAEQSRRATLPSVRPITLFDEVLAQAGSYDLKLIAALDPAALGLKTVLNAAPAASVLALIGPEGDFAPDEVAAAINAGFTPVSLGSRVLRVETAAVALASYVMLTLEG